MGAQRLQDRAPNEETFCEDVGSERVAIDAPLRLREPDLDHLPRVVPLVYRGGSVKPFVTLQPHQLASKRDRQHLRDLRLAHSRLALEKQRPPHLEREEYAGGEAAISNVVVMLEERDDGVDVGGERCGGHGIRGVEATREKLDYSVNGEGSRPPTYGSARTRSGRGSPR